MARLPTKLVAGPFVDIDAVDARDHLPAPARIFCFINRNAAARGERGGGPQVREVAGRKGRSRADDVAAKTECGRALGGEQMRTDNVFEIHTPVEIFIHLDVGVRISFPHCPVVVLFGKEPRCSEHDACKALVPIEDLAKVFR